jgi:hypothetical protein
MYEGAFAPLWTGRTGWVRERTLSVSAVASPIDARPTQQVLAEGETWSRRLAYMFEMKRLTRSGGT